MRLRVAALPPVLLAVVLMAPGGCGQTTADTGDFQGKEKDVAEAVFDFRDAVAKKDEKKICEAYFTDDLRKEIVRVAEADDAGVTCPEAIEDSIADVDATDISIEKVSIEGSTATVTLKTDITSGDDPTGTLQLVDERGWRISKLPG